MRYRSQLGILYLLINIEGEILIPSLALSHKIKGLEKHKGVLKAPGPAEIDR